MGIQMDIKALDDWGSEAADDKLGGGELRDTFKLDDLKDQLEELVENIDQQGNMAKAQELEIQILRLDALAEGMSGKTVTEIATEYVNHVGIPDYQTDVRAKVAETLGIEESSIPTPENVETPAIEFVEFGNSLFGNGSPYNDMLPGLNEVYLCYTQDVSHEFDDGINGIKYTSYELETVDGGTSGKFPAAFTPGADYEAPEMQIAQQEDLNVHFAVSMMNVNENMKNDPEITQKAEDGEYGEGIGKTANAIDSYIQRLDGI